MDSYYHLCHVSQIARQILEAHSTMLNMSLPDAKMQYIRDWQALQGFGITYFVIRVGKSKKDVSKKKGGEREREKRYMWRERERKGRRLALFVTIATSTCRSFLVLLITD